MVYLDKKFVLSHNFTDISKPKQYGFDHTPEEKHFNIPWGIGILHRTDGLAILCYCNKLQEKESMWTIDTVLEFTLKTSSGKVNRKDVKIKHQFTNVGSNCFAMQDFVGRDKLMKDYVVDDCVTAEVSVKIIEVTGFSEQELKIFDKSIVKKVPRSFDESNKKFSDVMITVDGKKFFVLKKFLAMHSSYFESLFLGKFEEADKEEVTLKDIDSTDFQNILEVIYGEPDINDETIDGVLHLAHMYDMPFAISKCEEFLIEESEQSMKDQLKIATKYQLENLKKACLSKINTVAEIKAALDENLVEMNPSVMAALLEKSLALH